MWFILPDEGTSVDELIGDEQTMELLLSGAALPPKEEVGFVMDRPFVFAIIGSGNLPLFVGIVNQPVE